MGKPHPIELPPSRTILARLQHLVFALQMIRQVLGHSKRIELELFRGSFVLSIHLCVSLSKVVRTSRDRTFFDAVDATNGDHAWGWIVLVGSVVAYAL